MIKLFGTAISGPVNKVRFAFNLMGLDYEFVNVNLMAGEHKSEDYLQKHPAGKVPAVQDGDRTLFESNAIIKYYASKNNSDLYPTELEQRAEVDQWLDFVSLHVNSAATRVFFNTLFAPKIPGYEVDEASLKFGLEMLSNLLPVLDKQLGQHKYLAGDKLTIADINLLSSLDPFEAVKIDLSPFTNIKKWRSELQAQDWYTKCHKNYNETLDSMFAAMK